MSKYTFKNNLTFISQEKLPSLIDIAGLPGTIGGFSSNACSSPSSKSCNLFKDTFAFATQNMIIKSVFRSWTGQDCQVQQGDIHSITCVIMLGSIQSGYLRIAKRESAVKAFEAVRSPSRSVQTPNATIVTKIGKAFNRKIFIYSTTQLLFRQDPQYEWNKKQQKLIMRLLTAANNCAFLNQPSSLSRISRTLDSKLLSQA